MSGRGLGVNKHPCLSITLVNKEFDLISLLKPVYQHFSDVFKRDQTYGAGAGDGGGVGGELRNGHPEGTCFSIWCYTVGVTLCWCYTAE